MNLKQPLLSLALTVMLLAACSPGARATDAPSVATEPSIEPVASATMAAPSLEAPTQVPVTQEATALPVATSRGPELEASDPTTVSLASGGLQFVEFFRFT